MPTGLVDEQQFATHIGVKVGFTATAQSAIGPGAAFLDAPPMFGAPTPVNSPSFGGRPHVETQPYQSRFDSQDSSDSSPRSASPVPSPRGPNSIFVDQVVVGAVNLSLQSKWTGQREEGLVTHDIPDNYDLHKAETDPQIADLFSKDVSWQPVCGEGGRIKIPMFHPESNIRLAWMMLGFGFIMWEVISVPFYIAFDVTPTGGAYVLESAVDAYFIADILVAFLSSYLDKYGNVIASPGPVARQYIRSWLLPDVVASIPWEWINLDTGQTGAEKVTRALRIIRSLRMVRLLRLVRLVKLGSILSAIEARLEANHTYTFIFGAMQVACSLAAVCHWSACMWYAIGTGEHYHDNYPDGEHMSWVVAYQETYPYIGQNKADHYIYSLYFCLTTMATVGYGDIAPRNFNEVRFAMILVVLATICFANLMGTLMSLLASLNQKSRLLVQKKVALSRYLHFRNVPWKLMMSIRHHLLLMWEANEGFDAYEGDLKMQLTPVLKQELCHHMYGRMLASAPFLVWMRDYPSCMKHLAQRVHPMFLSAGDQIFRMGEPNEAIYMLINGKVVISRIEFLYDQDVKKGGPRMDLKRRNSSRVQRGTNAAAAAAQKVAQILGPEGEAKRRPKRRFTLSAADIAGEQVLELAKLELKLADIRRRMAARSVQRVWRARAHLCAEAKGRGKMVSTATTQEQWLKKDRQKRRRIEAPAYLGESCLWQPLEDWGRAPPPMYLYTARCETAGELAYFPRAAVQEILDRFSPWIPKRLLHFQAVVQKKLDQFMQADIAFKNLVVDWAFPA